MMPMSKTEAKVINYLYTQGQDLRYAAEIAKELNIKKRTIYDTLDSLKRKGIVEEQLRGQMKFYKLSDKWRDIAEAAKIPIAETGEAPPSRPDIKGDQDKVIRELEQLLPIAHRAFGTPTVEELKKLVVSLRKKSRRGRFEK